MGKNRYKKELQIGSLNLAAASERARMKSMMVQLALQSQALTKKDIKNWRTAWQQAIAVENPTRVPLYSIYMDVDIDLHLTGCIGQRKGMVLKKSFKLCDVKGQENKEATELLEAKWFKDLISHALDSRYWGHSLIQLGDVVEIDGKPAYKETLLVPRTHVIPEFGVVVAEQGDDWRKGYDYRHSRMGDWVIEAGKTHDLGLFLKCATQTIPKKNMLAFWDQFGELFGMPVRIGKTTSRDPKEHSKIERMLEEMGAASWGLFPEGTEIEIKETTRGDAFNVYDKRIDRANSELSKGILNQTMTIDNGSSMSQSEVHLEVFQNVVDADSDFLRDLCNDQLLPRMVKHGFPVKGLRFWWDESTDYTPEQQVAYETMITDRYEVDPKYFIEKYNIPIIGKKENARIGLSRPFFD
ncbi:MAG: DUF935 domain-containing protein [Bacteroides pyogenes]|uniref:phage portal protein family protein n=1 Tax=Bacteroides pyogenes TaxID=310300 RepID=UPI001F1E61BA|nr:DUF935 family protein [Bacteroides pyogenes]MCE9106576.1 DUF935 domain-containing protein [Bacteroides pyogenes]MCI7071292.1 DUF935 domain-containing protein [Bacteroides pyogenes]